MTRRLSLASEEQVCRQFAQYLHLKHPELDGTWHFDFGSGTYLSIGQARRQAALNQRSWPDFELAVAGFMPGSIDTYHSLYIEAKKGGTRLHKKDGSWASEHLAEQAHTLDLLQEQGNYAVFGVGLDDLISILEAYLGTGPQEQETF
jgi:hypothetical protein